MTQLLGLIFWGAQMYKFRPTIKAKIQPTYTQKPNNKTLQPLIFNTIAHSGFVYFANGCSTH
jgi:hypothetical protein